MAIAIMLSMATANGLFPTIQNIITDRYFQKWSDPDVKDTASRVVIVAMDDKSIDALGRFGNWPRRYYAQVVDKLREGHARVIALDVGFLTPEADDPIVADSFKQFIAVDPDELRRAGVPLQRHSVVSPVVGTPDLTARPHEIPSYPARLDPQPIYRDPAVTTIFGHVDVIPDSDGVIRHTPPIIRAGPEGNLYPSLALATTMAYTNSTQFGFSQTADGDLLALNRRVPIPLDDASMMIISYVGPPSHPRDPSSQTFTVVSFIDVMQGQVDPATFRDKAVFLGALDASGIADDYTVPTSEGIGKMSGVEIHANAFATMLSARFFADQQPAMTIGLIWILCIVTALTVFRLSILASAVVALLVGIGYYEGTQLYISYVYDPAGVAIPNIVYPEAALVITFIWVTIYRVVFEQAEVRATRGAMGKYLSPAILTEVLRDPDKLRLGGEKREMTALFTDIRGFTSISEKLDPEALVKLLNEYLTEMTDIVHKWEGVLDKYMGDAIMAWWGAPTDQPDHPYRACMTALEMRKELSVLHEGWAQTGVPKLEMGIGVNTGPMVYGNTGSKERFDFTVLGDAVNLASRLEGVNKEYGSNVIISQSTWDRVADRDLVVRFLDMIEVKGKTEPVGIYELIGVKDQVSEMYFDLIEAWDEAMALYRAREFGLAEQAFQRVLEIAATDGPATVYVQRCAELRVNPPEPEWDGVFVMTHK
ncbi:MAG: adenylate cyclase [Chloroflexota bacterium]|jgi:adenylate cyclase|nr:adenylate cyclase [Chloroflexota bacterium]